MKESINLSYVRPQKRKYMEDIYKSASQNGGSLTHEHLADAVILPQKPGNGKLHGIGGVISNDNSFVELSGLREQFGGYYSFDQNVEYIDKCVCFCGYFINHWGHFLVDTVSRLWYSFEHDDEIDEYIFIVEENSDRIFKNNYNEFIELFGIKEKIRIVNKPTRFREVIVPEISFNKGGFVSELYLEIFERVVTAAFNKYKDCIQNDHNDKVFLSRNHLRGKSVEVGLDFLDDYFKKNGFTILYPEEISLGTLICILRNAKICAAESGTLPHNFLFAQNGKEILIIERQVTINLYQISVDIAKAFNATYIDANYEVYTTSSGYGPYLLGYTKSFELFTKDNNYIPPAEYYVSEKYQKKCLQQYIKNCDKEYGYARQHAPWQYIYRHAIFEAYNEAFEKFRPYLTKQTPLYWYQIFQLRFIKKFIRSLLPQ